MKNRIDHLALAWFVFAVATILASCVVPVPAPTKTSSPPTVKKIDLTFIKQSVTTRTEVLEKLGWCDVGARNKRAFVGRWSTSSSATFWFIGGVGQEGGAAGESGGSRNWATRTIIIEFDDRDLVQSSRMVPDRELIRELQALTERSRDRRFFETLPIELRLEHRHNRGDTSEPVRLVLARESLHFIEAGDHDFQIPPDLVSGFSLPKILKSDEEFPDQIRFTMYFSEKTKAGKQVTFFGTIADLMNLIEYQARAKSAKR